jgi:hypothetical protein
MLGHRLAEGALIADEGARLVVSLPNGDPFTQDMLRQYRQQILEAARRVRPDVRDVQFTSAPPGSPAGGMPVSDHPIVQTAVELFDGEITAVRPAARGPRRPPGEPGDAPAESGETT